MKHFIKQILQDKNGSFSLRELLIAVLILIIVVSWIAQQFFGKNIPEFMFYSFISLIAAGCFGYSLERKSFESSSNQKEN
jgi:choline-glycine betaine transporter